MLESYYDHNDKVALKGVVQVATYQYKYDHPSDTTYIKKEIALNKNGEPNGPETFFGIKKLEDEQKIRVTKKESNGNSVYLLSKSHESISGKK